MRRSYGNARAPHNKAKIDSIRNQNILGFGMIGLTTGHFLGGKRGALIFSLIGAKIGSDISPKR